jgi:predicted TIM-barrel fold metal-dependent hydrolase
MRHEVGLESVMWGSDFPHPEGSWPNTAQYLKDNFGNFPEQDGRQILGENAIKFYGLDRQRLQAIADEIGPTAALFN